MVFSPLIRLHGKGKGICIWNYGLTSVDFESIKRMILLNGPAWSGASLRDPEAAETLSQLSWRQQTTMSWMSCGERWPHNLNLSSTATRTWTLSTTTQVWKRTVSFSEELQPRAGPRRRSLKTREEWAHLHLCSWLRQTDKKQMGKNIKGH